MTPSQRMLIESSFASISSQAPQIVDRFYDRLLSQNPELKSLFEHLDMKQQQKKLIDALTVVVKSINKLDDVRDTLESMGAKHVEYGAVAEHYPVVATTLIESMAAVAGDQWTAEIGEAWAAGLTVVAEHMLRGAKVGV